MSEPIKKWVKVFVGESEVHNAAIKVTLQNADDVSDFITMLSKADELRSFDVPYFPGRTVANMSNVELFANLSNWVNRKDIANHPDAKPLAPDATLDDMGTVSNPIIVSFPAPAGKPSYLFSFLFIFSPYNHNIVAWPVITALISFHVFL
jgi:hypothetical protein